MFKGIVGSSVWTSGSNEGNSCDLVRSFAWCDTGILLNETDVMKADNWDAATGMPSGNASDPKCLTLKYDAAAQKVALGRSKCNGTMPFLCKVPQFSFNQPSLCGLY